MSYQPQSSITPSLRSQVEAAAALRERILGAAVELSWIPALQKDTRTRNVHASTAIEGNPLMQSSVTKKSPWKVSTTGGWNPPNDKGGEETVGGEETKLFAIASAWSVR